MHILANRMHKVLHTIISEDQYGYVKKRFIGYNIRLIEDIIYYRNKQLVYRPGYFTVHPPPGSKWTKIF